MWSIEKLTKSNNWVILEKSDSFKSASSFIKSKQSLEEKIYTFWDEKYPNSKNEMKKLMEQLFELNKGNQIRVFPNTKTTIENEATLCGCPSRCFCEWDNGKCSCWTSYCRPNGCNWVRCNGNC